MSLRCGIVGLPNVGKSTLFNALTNGHATAANFPFCTIEPNIGAVAVSDNRLKVLANIVKPNKVVPNYVEFVDIAGLVAGASKGEGLGNKFLANIREVDAIVHVTRCFDNDEIQHVAGHINPINDKEVIDCELQLKDLEVVSKRILTVEKSAKAGIKEAKVELELLKSVADHLSQAKNIRDINLDTDEKKIIDLLQLLTVKPVIYVANIDEKTLETSSSNSLLNEFSEAIAKENHILIPICISLEEQIARLSDEEKSIFLSEYGLTHSAIDRLTKICYQALGLITYFTVGVQEVRGWTISRGFKAPQAAGVIHSDFERGFIKAEVIKYEDYIFYMSENACKDAGKISIEGKNYVVNDGDIMHFRFNV